MNLENLKRVTYENKIRLPSLRNLDWRKVVVETEKNKRIITTYLNEKHRGIKWTNLCRSEVSCERIGVPVKARTETENLDGKLDWKRR